MEAAAEKFTTNKNNRQTRATDLPLSHESARTNRKSYQNINEQPGQVNGKKSVKQRARHLVGCLTLIRKGKVCACVCRDRGGESVDFLCIDKVKATKENYMFDLVNRTEITNV